MRHQNTRPAADTSTFPEQPVLDTSTVVATLTVSADGVVLAANAALRKWLDVCTDADLIGRPLAEWLAGANGWASWQAALSRGAVRAVDVQFRGRNGTVAALRGDITRLGDGGASGTRLLGVFVDTSAERQSRHALQRSARLEALASLTGGVAHDFNNLLTVLVGNLSLVAEELRGRPDTFAKLKASRDAAKRGSDLIRQLLGFARSGEAEAGVVDPVKVIENLLPLLSRALGSRISLHTAFADDACTLRANVAQLESVIVNLAVNARDAIESRGHVTISLERVRLSTAEAGARDLAPGSYVRLAVSDDGKGMPSKDLERVFEPFFTTKGDRGGTGLGLSMVRSFAAQNRGAAHIESEVGRGTSVVLLLPHCAEHLDETSAKTMPLSVLPTGSEHVAVLSSDEALQSTVRQILEALGYTVHSCADGDALSKVLRGPRCDLLISDGPVAESCAGDARVEAVLADCPGLPRIVLSAAPQPPNAQALEAVLMKPFSLADLADIVRRTLDSRGDSAQR